MNIINIKKTLLFFLLSVTIISCTDLEENLYDKVESSSYFTTNEEINLGLNSITQALLPLPAHSGYWSLQSIPSDEMIIPTRGGDWSDGGVPLAYHTHTWSSSVGWLERTWNDLYKIVARANIMISNIEGLGELNEDQKRGLAKAKVLRAYAYWALLDLFGTPPLVKEAIQDPSNLKGNATSKELYDFVESEITASIINLADSEVRGIVDKNVARAILANLYLNAETYTGESQWRKVITQVDSIAKTYKLSNTFPNNYGGGNAASTENIWVILGDPEININNEMNFSRRTLHYNQGEAFNIPGGGWNGYAVLGEFYDTFDDSDERKKWILEGQQYEKDGSTKIKNRQDKDLIFTKELPSADKDGILTDNIESAGFRLNKYDPRDATTVGNNYDSDFVVFGTAEMMLARAEAHVRLGNSTSGLEDVNTIRSRSGLSELTTLTLDDVYDERGRELCFEGKRRADLIRFGKYSDKWEFKTASGSHLKVFPIPQAQIDSNPNLKQNTGY